MKKIYIFVIVLVLVVLGFVIFSGQDEKLEAPILSNDNIEEKNVSDNEENVNPKTVVNDVSQSEVKEFVVSGQNFSFTPNSLTVKKGDKVKITFQSIDGFHDFKIDEYGVATKQLKSPAEEVLEFTADKVGSFEYYCSVGTHRAMGMFGTLKVE